MSRREPKASSTNRKRIIVSSSEDEDDDFQVAKFEKKSKLQVCIHSHPLPVNLPLMIENSVSEKDESEKESAVNDDTESSKLYSCPLCHSYSCTKKGTMKNHLKEKHPSTEIDGKKVTAGQCLVTDNLKIEEIKGMGKKSFKFPCTHQGCERGYNTEKGLRDHMVVHSEKFFLCCTVCGRVEKLNKSMNSHYKSNHLGIPFDYKACENLMDLLYEDAVKNGTKVEQPVYSCRMCEKSFKFPHLLKGHLSVHDPIPRTCTTCGKIFSSNRLCTAHMRIHDPNLRIFQCIKGNGCTKRFVRLHKLQEHENFSPVHNPELKFECDKCQRKFY